MEKKELFERIIKLGDIDKEKYPLFIIGIKNYYKNSEYKDAIIINSENVFASFNANIGQSLKEAIHYAHRITPSKFMQSKEIENLYGLDIVKGKLTMPNEENSLAIYPTQYEAFFSIVKSEAIRLLTHQQYDKRDIPFVIINIIDEEEELPI